MKKDYTVIPILEKKSEFFCAGKWQELFLYLNHGLSNSCHHPIPHEIPADLLSDPFVLHNTPHKLQMQQLMMQGQRPDECHMCWQIEDSNPDAVSDRIVKSQMEVDRIDSLRPDPKHIPRFIEVVFDNYCNLNCSYCDSGQSSSWATRVSQNPLPLDTDYRKLYSKIHIQPGSTKQEYFDAWMQWWPQIKNKLTTLKVSGGEPMMSPRFWQFVDSIGVCSNTNFSINSNFSVKTQLVDRFITNTDSFKSIIVGASIDCTGVLAEYARQGLDYQLFLDNIDYYFSNTDSRYKMYLQSTVNIFSVWGLIDKLNLNQELKRKYPGRILNLYTTVVKFPEFQSVLLLPEHLTQNLADNISKWIEQNKSDLSLDEISYVSKVASYLRYRPEHVSNIDKGKLMFDFKKFLLYYNEYSTHSYIDIFPEEFVEWIENNK